MASRAVRDSGTPFDGRVFDTGVSYFTVSDPDFALVVSELEAEGVVQPWTDTFHFAHSEGIAGVKMGPMRYRAENGIRSVVEYLARDLVIEEGEVSLASDEFSARPRVEAGWRIAPRSGLGYTVAQI